MNKTFWYLVVGGAGVWLFWELFIRNVAASEQAIANVDPQAMTVGIQIEKLNNLDETAARIKASTNLAFDPHYYDKWFVDPRLL